MLAELRSRPGYDSLLGTVMRWLLIGISLTFLAALLFAPLITVFATALAKGIHAYLAAFDDPDTRSAIKLTLITAAVVELAGMAAHVDFDEQVIIEGGQRPDMVVRLATASDLADRIR